MEEVAIRGSLAALLEWEGHAQVCHEHWAMLRSFARRRLRGREADADDFVQDALERYLKEFHGQPSPDNPAAWLMRTLHNLLISDWRKQHVQQRVPPEFLSPPPPEPSTRATMLEAVPPESFAQAVRSLSPKLREVYDLHLMGLSHAEIAQRLGIKETAVAKRMFDTRKRIKAVLAPLMRGHES